MQTALVLSDKIKSLSVIRMFSEYSFGISNLVLKFLPMVGSASSISRSSPLVSLTCLSFFIIKFLVWLSSTLTLRTKKFIDIPVDGARLKLSGGMSSGRSVVVPSKNGFVCVYMLRCRYVDLLDTLRLLLISFQVVHSL